MADPTREHAELDLAIGSKVRIAAAVDVTPVGLLAIGALVTSILLGTAVIVKVAVQRPTRPRLSDSGQRHES